MTVKKKAFSAVRWTSLAAFLRAFLQVAQVAVLARLLSPDDYGLAAMAGVVLSFASLFADMGLNSAYVQATNTTPEQRSSLFWLNIGFSLTVASIVVIFSPWLADFFKDERLSHLLMCSAPTFVILALGQQVRMAAEKQLNFRPVMLIEIVGAFVGFFGATISALFGLGAYSLIVSALLSALSGTALSWAFLAKGWCPLLSFSFADIKPFLGFGGGMVVSNLANQVCMSVDLVLGGRLLTSSQLGLYSLPRNLSLQVQLIVNPIITRVGFPLIAQVQNDIERVKAIYLKTLNMTASTNAPIYIGMAFFSPDVVKVFLGERWLDSIDLLKVFALWGGLRSIGNPAGSLLFGMGRSSLAVKWNIGFMFFAPVVLLGASHWGVAGLAWGLVAFVLVQYIAGWVLIVGPLCNAKFVEYCICSLRPFVFSGLSLSLAYLSLQGVESPLLRLSLGVLFSAFIYAVLSYRFNHDWFSSMMELLRKQS